MDNKPKESWFTQIKLPIEFRHKFVKIQDMCQHKNQHESLEAMITYFYQNPKALTALAKTTKELRGKVDDEKESEVQPNTKTV